MSLLEIIVGIAIFGFMVYLINKLIPMPPNIRNILNIVALIGLCVWLAYTFGLIDYLKRIRV